MIPPDFQAKFGGIMVLDLFRVLDWIFDFVLTNRLKSSPRLQRYCRREGQGGQQSRRSRGAPRIPYNNDYRLAPC